MISEKKAYMRTYMREYRAKNLQKMRQREREYYYKRRTNPDYVKKVREHNVIYHRQVTKPKREALRLEVLLVYGNQCACCGEAQKEFLTIDHINNDGAEHRKQIGKSTLEEWLKENNFPEGFQILCWNCNLAKYLYGVCPHVATP